MEICAGYIRVSTEDQEEYSPESQIRLLKEYAKKNDLILPDEFIFRDDGISGRTAKKRPAFQRMIGMAKENPRPFDAILVWKFSRFARNQEESIVYKSMLRSKCGVDVISVSEPLVDGPFGSLIERIIEWMDEYYSIRLSSEVYRGMEQKFSEGGVVSTPPSGYQMGDDVYIPDPERAGIVRLVFEQFVAGVGYKEIAEQLNAMGARTKRGNLFENRSVQYILKNPTYLGKLRWSKGRKSWNSDEMNQSLVDGQHEPLITLELWEAAQARIADLKKLYPKYAREASSRGGFMLQGLIRCSDCGSTLVRSGDGLQCHRYSRGSCIRSHYISMAQADERVISMLEEGFHNHTLQIVIRNPGPASREQAEIKAQIQREKKKLDRILAAYEDGIDTIEEYKEKKARILAAVQKLEQQLNAKPQKISVEDYIREKASLLKDLRNPELSDSEKNAILRSFVDRILFDRESNRFSVTCYA